MKKIVYALILSIFATNITAQTITLDLAKDSSSSFTQTIDPQVIKSIILKNKLPDNTSYKISVKKETITVVPLPFTLSGEDKSMTANRSCSAIEKVISELLAAKNEKEIPKLIKKLKEEINKSSKGNCDESIYKANQLISMTEDVNTLPSSISIKAGEMVTITVEREKITWKYVFNTEQISHWKTYYGFSYVSPGFLTYYRNYYALKDTSNTYLIKKSNQSTKNQFKNITPTLMFSYLFFNNPNAPLKFGLTAGFQVDLNTPSALFCPSLVIGDNVSLNVGIAFTQKYTLKGQYKLDQRISENLDFDQLHDKIWTYDIFFSIAFRFEKNPFKKSVVKDNSDSKE